MFENIYVLVGCAFVLLFVVIALLWMIQPRSAPPGKPVRYCPLCKSELAENETLKGLIVDTTPPQKILIRGCTRCAPPNEGGQW